MTWARPKSFVHQARQPQPIYRYPETDLSELLMCLEKMELEQRRNLQRTKPVYALVHQLLADHVGITTMSMQPFPQPAFQPVKRLFALRLSTA
jgi:hypothetical protein